MPLSTLKPQQPWIPLDGLNYFRSKSKCVTSPFKQLTHQVCWWKTDDKLFSELIKHVLVILGNIIHGNSGFMYRLLPFGYSSDTLLYNTWWWTLSSHCRLDPKPWFMQHALRIGSGSGHMNTSRHFCSQSYHIVSVMVIVKELAPGNYLIT